MIVLSCSNFAINILPTLYGFYKSLRIKFLKYRLKRAMERRAREAAQRVKDVDLER